MKSIKWRFKGHHKEFITPEGMLPAQVHRWRTRLDLDPMTPYEVIEPKQQPKNDPDPITVPASSDISGDSNPDDPELKTVPKTPRKRSRSRSKTN